MRVLTGLWIAGMLATPFCWAAEPCGAQAQVAGDGLASQPPSRPDNLAAVVAGEDLKQRFGPLEAWGFTQEDMKLIFWSKVQMHRLREQLEDQLQALAVAMYSESADPGEQQQAARDALDKYRSIEEQDRQLQEQLLQRLGAADDPVKLSGLILLGVYGSGRRSLCEVKPGVSGGAQGVGVGLQGLGLRGAIGRPGLPGRARPPVGLAPMHAQPGLPLRPRGAAPPP